MRELMNERIVLSKWVGVAVLCVASAATQVGAQSRSVPTSRSASATVFGYQIGDQVVTKANGPTGSAAVATTTPFLYLEGAFGGRWTVDGFGSNASSQQLNQITIQHNETIALDFEGFGPMLKTAGSASGLQQMDWNIGVQVLSSGGGVLPGSTGGLVLPATLNATFQPASPLYTPGVTGGVLHLQVRRQAVVLSGHEPGRYENQGSITLYRY